MPDIYLKHIPYRSSCCAGIGDIDGILDYAILPDERCIFSGVTRDSQSTVMAIETIIPNICRRENLDPKSVRFFDLRTCRSSGTDGYLEHFEFDQVLFGVDLSGDIVDSGWEHREAPLEVLNLFKEHIGTIIFPVITPEEATAQGFSKDSYVCNRESAEECLARAKFERVKADELHLYAIVDRSSADSNRFELHRKGYRPPAST
jgi:hypothetical protein